MLIHRNFESITTYHSQNTGYDFELIVCVLSPRFGFGSLKARYKFMYLLTYLLMTVRFKTPLLLLAHEDSYDCASGRVDEAVPYGKGVEMV